MSKLEATIILLAKPNEPPWIIRFMSSYGPHQVASGFSEAYSRDAALVFETEDNIHVSVPAREVLVFTVKALPNE